MLKDDMKVPHMSLGSENDASVAWLDKCFTIWLQILKVIAQTRQSSKAQSMVVITCLGGAFLGSVLSGLIGDVVGRLRGFQLSALAMILSARTESLEAWSTNGCWSFYCFSIWLRYAFL